MRDKWNPGNAAESLGTFHRQMGHAPGARLSGAPLFCPMGPAGLEPATGRCERCVPTPKTTDNLSLVADFVESASMQFQGLKRSRVPLAFVLSPGDTTAYDELMDPDEDRPQALLADRGHDRDAIREDSWLRGTDPVIATKINRKLQRPVDPRLHALLNRIERFFDKPKSARRVATRYDETADGILAFVQLASIKIRRRFVNRSETGIHRIGAAPRQDEAGGFAPGRTDGAEDAGPFGSLVVRRTRPGSAFCPAPRNLILPAEDAAGGKHAASIHFKNARLS